MRSHDYGSVPVVLWGKDDDGCPVYSLAEFLIFPSKMRFCVNYGIHSIEPYLYDGEFTRAADGSVAVGKVNLTRLHMDPQQSPEGDGLKPAP